MTTGIIQSSIERLIASYRYSYGFQKLEYGELIADVARVAFKHISKSDAPYHDVEHTVLVALAGAEILRGKQITEGNVSPEDWLHAIASLLLHDIGYVKGVCRQDKLDARCFDTGIDGEMIYLPPDATDASLTPYHVDRGKLFAKEYFSHHKLLDIKTLQRNIELTRFPVPPDAEHEDTIDYPGLARAADLIGQLADPLYLKKMKALFREFEEIGTNKVLGYRTIADLRAGYPNFFWGVVYQYLGGGLQHLKVTKSGQIIVENLYENVKIVERELSKSTADSPQSAANGKSSNAGDRLPDPDAAETAHSATSDQRSTSAMANKYLT
jgi:hypothetical protein